MRFACIVVTAILAGCAPVGRAPLATREWHLDRLDRIGDLRSELIGAPVVRRDGLEAVCFDGKADGFLLPENPIEGQRQFTVEALIKPDVDGAEEQRFLHIEDTRGQRALMEIRLAGGRWSLDTFLRATDTSKLTLLDRGRTQAAGEWHWVALVYDGTTMSHYVDGEKQLEGRVEFPAMASGQTSLGVRQNRVHWFKGCISRVRFTPMALRSPDLQQAN